jgi:hypothetical protein
MLTSLRPQELVIITSEPLYGVVRRGEWGRSKGRFDVRRNAIWLAAVALVVAGATTAVAASDNFRTHLSGDEEVPAVVTGAQGQANFKLSDDGQSISYRLNVANIENVTQAHIHMGPVGGTGGIVVWLYPSAPPQVLIPGRTNGNLAEGTITAANLTGGLANQPLSALLDLISDGNAYVNVHTSQNASGEIRGQL